MAFRGITAEQFRHGDTPSVGVLLCNLGTPDAPTAKAVRPYLSQFLSDPRVIEENRLKWWLVLNGIILRLRPRKSAALYKKVWTPEGSPLLVNTKAICSEFEKSLKKSFSGKVLVEVGMRYGNPSISSALEKLIALGADRILALPLFPQYSATTTGTIFDEVVRSLTEYRAVPEFRMVMRYHDDAAYIDAVARSIQEVWDRDGRADKLLFSFHGIPKRYYVSGDPYPCYCLKTGRLVAERLGLTKDQYVICFQSLFGKEEWIRPYTIDTIRTLPSRGVKRLDVVCPGFVTDCLETLEEIDVENRAAFMENGGERFRYIPAVNSSSDFIRSLHGLFELNTAGWDIARMNSQELQAVGAERCRHFEDYTKSK